MRRIALGFGLIFGVAVWAAPGWAGIDLVDRLQEKGILTAEEAAELHKEAARQPVVGPSLAYESADGGFAGQIYGYGQARYTFVDKEDADNKSGFNVKRVRMGLKGHAFSKDLRFKVYLNIYSGNEKGADLFDYYADYVPSPVFGIRAGAWKVPYGFQWTTSAGKLQFVERTAVDANFRFDRDTGVVVHGWLFGKRLAYDTGVFNGEGRNKKNSGDKHLWVARVKVDPLGAFPTTESDNGAEKTFRVRLGAAVAFDDDVASHTRKNLNDRLTALGASDVTSIDLFLGAAWKGLSARAEGHQRRIDPNDSAKDAETARGFYAQTGVFLVPGKLETAARVEWFDPDTDRDAGDDLRREYGVALNYFFAGQKSKIQGDLFRVSTQTAPGEAEDDTRFRVQYQLAF